MSSNKDQPLMPPRTHTTAGAMRRVGVELEMTGLTLQQVAALVAEHVVGRIRERGRYERVIDGDDAGEWVVELDFEYLKKLGREERDNNSLLADISHSAEQLLARVAEAVVPIEVVSPPLPLSRLPEVEALIAALRDAGALGSSDSLLYAFGMQFNPELVDCADTQDIVASLKAFLCLYEWLLQRAQVDLSRRMTSYIDPFPDIYVAKVLDTDYWPDQATLIDDYLQDNATRNRALDLLPLFLHLDQERVRAVSDDERIKARPTFHYRLPNCEIHQPGWGMHQAWNEWLEVERLAEDRKRLDACCKALLSHLASRQSGDAWAQEVSERWLAR